MPESLFASILCVKKIHILSNTGGQNGPGAPASVATSRKFIVKFYIWPGACLRIRNDLAAANDPSLFFVQANSRNRRLHLTRTIDIPTILISPTLLSIPPPPTRSLRSHSSIFRFSCSLAASTCPEYMCGF